MKRFLSFLAFAAIASVGHAANTDADNVQLTQRNEDGTRWVTRYLPSTVQITTLGQLLAASGGATAAEMDAAIAAAISTERDASRTLTGATISGASNTLTGTPETYDTTGWNGDTSVPTKDDIRDKIESLGSGVALATESELNVAEAMTSSNRKGRAVNTSENTHTLTMVGNITLSEDNTADLGKAFQVLDPDGSNRTVTLPTNGDFYTVFNTGGTFFERIDVLNPSAANIGRIYGGLNGTFIKVAGAWQGFAPRIEYDEIHVPSPQSVQSVSDAIPLLWIDDFVAPNGITVLGCIVRTGASSTYSAVFEEWSDPVTAVADIETVATSASIEAEDFSFANTSIASGNGIMVDLPTTTVTWVTFAVVYVINP